MKQPKNYYRYTVTNRLGVISANPLGESDFIIQWKRQAEEKLDYQKDLPSKVIFTGAVYQNLLKLEKSIYRCDVMQIAVERNCGGVWQPWFSGRLGLNDGTWDLDLCQVEIKLDQLKPDQCFEDNKGTDVNLLQEIFQRRTVYLNPTNITIETVDYTQFGNAGSPACGGAYYWGGTGQPEDGAWIVYAHTWTVTRDTGQEQCDTLTSWARETILVPCANPSPGSEWILVQDTCPGGQKKYARPAKIYGCTYTYPDYNAISQTTSMSCSIAGMAGGLQSIDNGVTLKSVLEMFCGKFCPGITPVSNFFQINPTQPSTINYVTGMASKTRHITLFQKSDVKRPSASGNATKALFSFEKLMGALVKMFNVRWRVVGQNLVIEHVSAFTQSVGFDLTQSRWAKYMVKKNRYSYQKESIPAREEFKFMESGYATDFVGLPIVYNSGCVSRETRDAVKVYAVENVTTDVELCVSNPQHDSNVVSDEGFVFMATEFDGTNYYIITEAGILGSPRLNNTLAWAQLHRDYHKHYRPLKTGLMNGQQTTFLSTIPTKKGEKITIPLCCGDNFNPDNLIKTPLGFGTVDQANYSFKKETLELELLYPAYEGLTQNAAPVAGNDVATTNLNVPISITVLANDSDSDGVITAVEIVLAPTHGTAVVQSDKKVLYTPANGYTGDDYFVYRIRDDWGEASNNALVAILVKPANTAPVANNDSYNVNQNTQLNVPAPGLFANDSDDTGFTLDTYDVTSANGGSVVVNGTGSFTYNPAAGFVGVDTFTYRIKDAQGLTDTATVSIDVRNPNNPIANDDAYSTPRNTNLVVGAPGLLANDTTTIGSLSTLAQNAPTFHGGTVSIGSNGAFTYVPPANFTGEDYFIYTASNSTGNDQATARVNVLPAIYAKIMVEPTGYDFLTMECGFGTQDAGERYRGNVKIYFYSNAGGTVPMDVTGLNLQVNIRITGIYGNPSANASTSDSFIIGSGTVTTFLADWPYYHNQAQCQGGYAEYRDESYSLRPGAYTII